MVVDAFIYFVAIGSGTATGVGIVAWIGWKIIQRSNRKGNVEKNKRKAVV
ncbi:hypothetical protein [Desertibacillus haloalkaliphilus]|nr:hypothetical protein [Desertibacillus haloalkaliphilus]MBU8905579.1 hypothetical protein [Desertibacillus haloalkaliphilus]